MKEIVKILDIFNSIMDEISPKDTKEYIKYRLKGAERHIRWCMARIASLKDGYPGVTVPPEIDNLYNLVGCGYDRFLEVKEQCIILPDSIKLAAVLDKAETSIFKHSQGICGKGEALMAVLEAEVAFLSAEKAGHPIPRTFKERLTYIKAEKHRIPA